MNKRIWVICDNIIGNSNQSIALAEKIGLEYTKKNISYNIFSRLPNILKGSSLIGINIDKSDSLKEPYPDLVIATGRKTSLISRYIKHQNPATKIINILWPETGIKFFDLILLPHHDNHKDKCNNIMRIAGAITKINPDFLAKNENYWREKFKKYKRPIIVVLIGGNTKKGPFTEEDGKILAKKVNDFAINQNASILISTSRRTDNKVIKQLSEYITAPNYIYTYGCNDENPYIGFLAISDYIFTTGDSISMCVDACSSGKKTFIYTNENFIPKKHRKFLDNLFNNNYAKELHYHNDIKDFKEHVILNNEKTIIEIIKKRFL